MISDKIRWDKIRSDQIMLDENRRRKMKSDKMNWG